MKQTCTPHLTLILIFFCRIDFTFNSQQFACLFILIMLFLHFSLLVCAALPSHLPLLFELLFSPHYLHLLCLNYSSTQTPLSSYSHHLYSILTLLLQLIVSHHAPLIVFCTVSYFSGCLTKHGVRIGNMPQNLYCR